jgi:CRISPR-associated protein Csy1
MTHLTPTASQLRKIIRDFIDGRLVEKQQGKPDDGPQSFAGKYDHDTWLRNASRKASQLTVVTHAPKFSYQYSKSDGLRFESSEEALEGLVYSVGTPLKDDAIGNAAALDVFKFLQLTYAGETLLSRVLRDDPEIAAALSDDATAAAGLMGDFKLIACAAGTAACDTFIKQIYFPINNDSYHLLGILHPTSLAHLFHERIQHDKFSEETKAAKEARKAWEKNSKPGKSSPEAHVLKGESALPVASAYRVYPDLAVTKFGGSKPQNISQLNSERRGVGYLLASVPPTWASRPPSLPSKQSTVFDRSLAGQLSLRKALSRLKVYYGNPYGNAALRDWAHERISEIIEQVMALADRIQQAEPAWSIGSRLHPAEVAWLDPDRELADPGYHAFADWRETVSSHFANWLNENLSGKTIIMNQDAAGEWQRRFLKELSATR